MAKRRGLLDISMAYFVRFVSALPCGERKRELTKKPYNSVVAAAEPHRHLNLHRLQVVDARDGRRELV